MSGDESQQSGGRLGGGSRRTAALIQLAFFFLLAGAVWVLVTRYVGTRPMRDDAWASSSSLQSQCGARIGSADAPLEVIAILPIATGCQDAIGRYLVDTAKDNGSWISVTVLDMKSEAGREAMSSHGVRCACVLINGTTRFDLVHGDGRVLLEGPMDPADLHAALRSEAARAGVLEKITLAAPPVIDLPKRRTPPPDLEPES